MVSQRLNDVLRLLGRRQKFNHALNSSCSVHVLRNIHKCRSNNFHNSQALRVGAMLQQLLTEVVSERIGHQFHHVFVDFSKNYLNGTGGFLFKLLLQEAAAMLIFAERINLAKALVQGGEAECWVSTTKKGGVGVLLPLYSGGGRVGQTLVCTLFLVLQLVSQINFRDKGISIQTRVIHGGRYRDLALVLRNHPMVDRQRNMSIAAAVTTAAIPLGVKAASMRCHSGRMVVIFAWVVHHWVALLGHHLVAHAMLHLHVHHHRIVVWHPMGHTRHHSNISRHGRQRHAVRHPSLRVRMGMRKHSMPPRMDTPGLVVGMKLLLLMQWGFGWLGHKRAKLGMGRSFPNAAPHSSKNIALGRKSSLHCIILVVADVHATHGGSEVVAQKAGITILVEKRLVKRKVVDIFHLPLLVWPSSPPTISSVHGRWRWRGTAIINYARQNSFLDWVRSIRNFLLQKHAKRRGFWIFVMVHVIGIEFFIVVTSPCVGKCTTVISAKCKQRLSVEFQRGRRRHRPVRRTVRVSTVLGRIF
mmetsp:Transcript_11492/g.28947  ORF Transcript_11492/g.28947 Transcript_11492/m.28947 type:complete len:528 (+) Transcript_11492:1176-2759(+)